MFLRFAIDDRDEDSGRGRGIFHAARNLCEHGDIAQTEIDQIERIRDWFNQNLEKPNRFTAAKPPYRGMQPKAISWFKDTATEHLNQARALRAILERHGAVVHIYDAPRVGYIVYKDEIQIVAEPFADTVS